jgi:16S rRNA G1207 methylase RsmC
MAHRKLRNKNEVFGEMVGLVAKKLQPPFGIVMGSPLEAAELASRLPAEQCVCYQMDLFQAERLRGELQLRELDAKVHVGADLWDMPPVQTLLYPVPYGGERALKLDLVEQAYHTLNPHGTFIVLSPYDRDQFFPQVLKKVFGKVHAPMTGENAVFWCSRDGDKKRRRHEVEFQVRVDETTSYRFLSRPGVFSYGHFDDGARALVDVMEIEPGNRVCDLGCGIGTNGILAARLAGPEGHITFIDSSLRAIALTEINARALGVPNFTTHATSTVSGLDEGSFDVVLANPPYFAHKTIADLFITRGLALLRKGGLFFLVSKQVDAVYPMIQAAFGEPELFEHRGYILFKCQKA